MYHLFMRILGRLARLKVKQVSGTEHIPKTSPVIFAANHVGFFDAPALAASVYAVRPNVIHFLTYDLMWRLWGGPFATRTMGMVRLHPRDAAGSLQQMIEIVQAGKVAAIFPEGSRNPHPESLLVGKTGVARMALATGAPVIPVGIYNATGRTIGQAFASFLKPDKQIRVVFGQPIDLGQFQNQPITRELLHQVTDVVMRDIAQLSHTHYTRSA